jgi:hypothetical protein
MNAKRASMTDSNMAAARVQKQNAIAVAALKLEAVLLSMRVPEQTIEACSVSGGFKPFVAYHNGFRAFRALEVDRIRHRPCEVIRDEWFQVRQCMLVELAPVAAFGLSRIWPARVKVGTQFVPGVRQPFDLWPPVRTDYLKWHRRRSIQPLLRCNRKYSIVLATGIDLKQGLKRLWRLPCSCESL